MVKWDAEKIANEFIDSWCTFEDETQDLAAWNKLVELLTDAYDEGFEDAREIFD